MKGNLGHQPPASLNVRDEAEERKEKAKFGRGRLTIRKNDENENANG